MLRLMFLTVGILVSVSAILDEDEKKFLYKPIAKCMEQFEITMEKYEEAVTNNGFLNFDPCFVACEMKEIGIINENGKFNHEQGIAMAEKHIKNPDHLAKFKKTGDICLAVNDVEVSDGNKGCERVMLLRECFKENRFYE